MTVKEFLCQAQYLDARINYHIREKEQLYHMASAISSPRMEEDKVQTSPSGEAPHVRVLMKVLEMEERIVAEIDQLVDLKEQINASLDLMDNPEESTLLRLHYVYGYSIAKIADEQYMGRTSVKRKLASALENFVLPENPIVI